MVTKLYNACNTPQPVREHCKKVAETALLLAKQLEEPIDKKLLETACLLHDLMRTGGRRHPELGAEVLKKQGCTAVAKIVAQHHDLEKNAPIEAEILYLADKLVQGVQIVPIEERFKKSYSKCKTVQAKTVWEKRYKDTREIIRKYQLKVEEIV